MRQPALRNMLSGGALSMVRLVSGVIRVKIVALCLGAAGVGVYSLVQQVLTAGTALVSISLAVPMINLGRPHVADERFDEAGRIVGTVCLVLAINVALLLALWLGFGTRLVTGGWPVVLAIAIAAGSAAFWEGLTYLCNRFDAYVKANMVASLADAAIVGLAAWKFGLDGVIMALPLSALALFCGYGAIMLRDGTARAVLAWTRASLRLLPKVLGYSAMMIATVALTSVVQTWLRGQVLHGSGAVANGYLQPATALAAYLLSFVMTGYWGHLHARAAAEGDTPAVRVELQRALLLGLGISFAGCLCVVIAAPIVVPLFYAGEFAPASGLVRPYMLGEFCFQLFSMLAAYQLTAGLRRNYLALNLGYVGLLALVGSRLIPVMGSSGYVLGHMAAAAAMVTAALALAWRRGQMGGRQVLAFVAMLAVLAIAVVALGGVIPPAKLA